MEEVGQGSALAAAGLQVDDVLLSWQRVPSPTANPEGAEGQIDSMFDWLWLQAEQAPRGAVQLTVLRAQERAVVTVSPGVWEAQVRPAMSAEILEAYLAGKDQMAAEEYEAASRWWETALGHLGTDPDWRARCSSYLHMGRLWSQAGEWERARAALDSALTAAQDPWSQVTIWQAIGDVLDDQREPQPAREAYAEALEISQKAWGESLVVARAMFDLGLTDKDLADFESAHRYLQGALELQEKFAPGSLAVGASLNNLGSVTHWRGDMEGSQDYFERALKIRQQLAPNSLLVASTVNNLGSMALSRGDLKLAADHLEEALELRAELAPGSLHEAASLSNLAGVFFFRGDLESAAEYLTRALAIRQKLAPDSLDVAASLGNLGSVADSRGDLEASIQYIQRDLEITQKLAPDSLRVAFVLTNLGKVALDKGDLDFSQECLEGALEIQRKLAPNSLDLARSLYNLGNVALERGELEQATDYHQRSLSLRQELSPGSLFLAGSLADLGKVAVQSQQLELANDYFNRALKIRSHLAQGSAEEAETLYELGKLSRQQDEPQLASDYFQKSLASLEAAASKLGGSHRLQAGFRSGFVWYYRDAIDLLLELGQPEEAFHILERSRARSFLALLAERETVFSADIPAELDQARRRLAVQYDRTQQQIVNLSPDDQAEELEAVLNRLRELRDEYDNIEQQIRQASPKLAALQYPQPRKLAEVQEALDPGTVLLSYSVGREQTVLFAVTREDGFRAEVLDLGEEELRRDVELFLNLIRQSTNPESRLFGRVTSTGKRLYSSLVAPVIDIVDHHERILIVPDGPLHHFPFGALVRPRDSSTLSGKEWSYLAEEKPIYFTLSGTVYAEQRKLLPESRPAGDVPESVGMVAFGDPLYRQEPAGGTDRATVAATDSTVTVGQADAQVRAASKRFSFDSLPGTRHEVERIAELYRGAGTRTYLGADATEERAKAIGRGPRYVHFATHGLLDERTPLDSALVLSLDEQLTEGRENGLLQVWEIFERLRLDADLVVLSACQTAKGELLGGEGLIGLTRAFQYAGARSVAATLWSVDDPTTSELMVRFYRHLRAGVPKAEALRAAQMELMRAPIEIQRGERVVKKDASAPYYWAAFQLYGEDG